MISNKNASDKLSSKALGKISEMAFIVNKFNSHLKTCSDKETFLQMSTSILLKGI